LILDKKEKIFYNKMVIVKYFLKDGYEEMESIRIKNVKSLMDTNEVFLSPITLLVGKNSSGKSTFLRTFPLIKQSIRKRTDGPLLWAGDVDDYVDFGSFLETVTDNELDDHPIEFQFNFKLSLTTDIIFGTYGEDLAFVMVFRLLRRGVRNIFLVCQLIFVIVILSLKCNLIHAM